jgi:hypothetical protein
MAAQIQTPNEEEMSEGDAARRIAPALSERRDDEFRRNDGDRRIDRAMPGRRDFVRPEISWDRGTTRVGTNPCARMHRPFGPPDAPRALDFAATAAVGAAPEQPNDVSTKLIS